jgi:lipoprotein NlpD
MNTDAFIFIDSRATSLRSCLLSMLIALLVAGCAGGPSGGPSKAVIDDRTSSNAERRKSALATNRPATTTAGKTSESTAKDAESKTDTAKDKKADSSKTPQSSEALPQADSDPAGYYTVKPGDSLRKIAEQFSRSVAELSDWNGLSNPNDIKAGRMLRIAPPDTSQVMSVPVESDMEIKRAGRPVKSSNAPQASAKVASLHKTGPSGQKIVYSDKALADIERGDPGPVRTLEPVKKATDAPPAAANTSRFVWPTEGKVISGFDATRKSMDIAGKAGQPVVAAGDGKVLYAKNMRGYGNLIILEHGDGMVTAYAHNKTILVREGQTVSQRQQIAEMGDTDADSVKLRFEMRRMGKPIDPTTLLPRAEAETSSSQTSPAR